MLDPLALNGVQSVGETQGELASQRLADDLNQFLNLLVTQLENQDPLDPLDPNEFTSQLVQFASVEQQIYQNQNLEDMLELQQASLLGTVVGYIGSQVEVQGSTLSLENGQSRFTYNLEASAANTTITISDSNGRTVYFTDGETDAGSHEFAWNGTDNFGFPLEDGAYTLNVNSLDPDGNPVNVGTTVIGTVSGVSTDNGKTLLSIGEAQYSIDQVLAIRAPVEQAASQ